MANYVDNWSIYLALREWKKQCKFAGKQLPVTDEIGYAIMQIANNLVRRFNFCNYTQDWKEAMVGDGIDACLKGISNFDTDKYTNVYGYITKACFRAFVQRIWKERAETATKYKYFVSHVYDGNDEDMYQMADEAFIQDIHDKISAFDEALERKKKKPEQETEPESERTESLPDPDFFTYENDD